MLNYILTDRIEILYQIGFAQNEIGNNEQIFLDYNKALSVRSQKSKQNFIQIHWKLRRGIRPYEQQVEFNRGIFIFFLQKNNQQFILIRSTLRNIDQTHQDFAKSIQFTLYVLAYTSILINVLSQQVLNICQWEKQSIVDSKIQYQVIKIFYTDQKADQIQGKQSINYPQLRNGQFDLILKIQNLISFLIIQKQRIWIKRIVSAINLKITLFVQQNISFASKKGNANIFKRNQSGGIVLLNQQNNSNLYQLIKIGYFNIILHLIRLINFRQHLRECNQEFTILRRVKILVGDVIDQQ
ncbi:unnamed protein product [Paramecium pentaurelia]|uniref:Uncharacterized protein n=1 Tax=Paramecium pentaurelia TaxID=43138 RepID=A0A8S1TRC1_9CILI|nr:unnamed protein product [Paramecium pentaurelia]